MTLWATLCAGAAAGAAWCACGPPPATVRLRGLHGRGNGPGTDAEEIVGAQAGGAAGRSADGFADGLTDGLTAGPVGRFTEVRPASGAPRGGGALRLPVRRISTDWKVAAGRSRRAALWRSAVIALCDGLTAELAAGRTPEGALAATVAVLDPQVAGALLDPAVGGPADPTRPPPEPDVPALLEHAAGRPGAEGLRLVAACWRVGAQSGGTFAAAVEGVGAALREEEAHRLEVGAQLAGARASARLLAGLPLLGLALATALGARPMAFLLGTPYGVVCLVTGAGLDGLGWWWTRRLACAAEGP